MNSKKKRKLELENRTANVPALVWVAGVAASSYAVADVHLSGREAALDPDLTLPVIVDAAIQAGAVLATPIGQAALVGFVGLSLVPAIVARGGSVRKLYTGLAVLALVAAGLIGFGGSNALRQFVEAVEDARPLP